MSIVASIARNDSRRGSPERLLWLTVAVVVLAFGLAQFLAQVAIAETMEIQAALLAAPLRVAAVFIVAVFVITSMVRESNDKITEPAAVAGRLPRSAYFFPENSPGTRRWR